LKIICKISKIENLKIYCHHFIFIISSHNMKIVQATKNGQITLPKKFRLKNLQKGIFSSKNKKEENLSGKIDSVLYS